MLVLFASKWITLLVILVGIHIYKFVLFDVSATNKIDNLACVDYHKTHWSLLLYFCGTIEVMFIQ